MKMSKNHETATILSSRRGAPLTIGSIIVAILLGTLIAGKQYTGSWVGNILYIVSVSFLITLLILNIYRWQELNHLTGNRLYSLITVYLLSIPIIYIINAIEHPSKFLTTLFFFYFFLALIWTFLVEKRQFTNFSILLFLLCLTPLIYGIYIYSNYEEPINQDILLLEAKKEHYNDQLMDISLGIKSEVIPPDLNVETDVPKFGEDLEEAKKYYQRADYNGCSERIKRLKNLTEELDDDLEWLTPEKKVLDELFVIDEQVSIREKRYTHLVPIINKNNNSEKDIYLKVHIKGIGIKLSELRKKLDEAQLSYCKRDMVTYEDIRRLKSEFYRNLSNIDDEVRQQKGGATW
jgi:hypothetical protein